MVDVYQTQNPPCTKETAKSLPASIMYDFEEVQARARRGIQYELMCAPMIHERFPSDKFQVFLGDSIPRSVARFVQGKGKLLDALPLQDKTPNRERISPHMGLDGVAISIDGDTPESERIHAIEIKTSHTITKEVLVGVANLQLERVMIGQYRLLPYVLFRPPSGHFFSTTNAIALRHNIRSVCDGPPLPPLTDFYSKKKEGGAAAAAAASSTAPPRFDPYDYQTEMEEQCLEAIHTHRMIKATAPTGTGKASVISMICGKLSGRLRIIITPGRDLCKRMVETYHHVCPGSTNVVHLSSLAVTTKKKEENGDESSILVSHFKKKLEDTHDLVVVTTLHTFETMMRDDDLKMYDKEWFAVVDEAHRFPFETHCCTRKEGCFLFHAKFLFFSATLPTKMTRKAQVVFDEQVHLAYKMTAEDAFSTGKALPLTFYVIKTSPDYDFNVMCAHTLVEVNARTVLAFYSQDVERKRAITTMRRVFEDKYPLMKIKMEQISSDTRASERTLIRQEDIDLHIRFNIQVGREGYDEPEIDTIIIHTVPNDHSTKRIHPGEVLHQMQARVRTRTGRSRSRVLLPEEKQAFAWQAIYDPDDKYSEFFTVPAKPDALQFQSLDNLVEYYASRPRQEKRERKDRFLEYTRSNEAPRSQHSLLTRLCNTIDALVEATSKQPNHEEKPKSVMIGGKACDVDKLRTQLSQIKKAYLDKVTHAKLSDDYKKKIESCPWLKEYVTKQSGGTVSFLKQHTPDKEYTDGLENLKDDPFTKQEIYDFIHSIRWDINDTSSRAVSNLLLQKDGGDRLTLTYNKEEFSAIVEGLGELRKSRKVNLFVLEPRLNEAIANINVQIKQRFGKEKEEGTHGDHQCILGHLSSMQAKEMGHSKYMDYYKNRIEVVKDYRQKQEQASSQKGGSKRKRGSSGSSASSASSASSSQWVDE